MYILRSQNIRIAKLIEYLITTGPSLSDGDHQFELFTD